MIACLTDGLLLRAPLVQRPELGEAGRARAGARDAAARPGPCTRAAHEAGVRPGMRLSEALSMCPRLELVEQDPAWVEQAWEAVLRRLEEAGFAVEPVAPGCAYFETRGMERLAGGLAESLRRALAAVGEVGGSCGGGLPALRGAGGGDRGAGRPGARHRRRRGASLLEPLPLDLLPLSPERRDELSELGVKRLGELARLPGGGRGPARRRRRGGLAARQGRRGRLGRASPASGRDRGDARLSGAGGERADARAGAGGARRAPARPLGAGRPGPAAARALGEARRRRLLAAHR